LDEALLLPQRSLKRSSLTPRAQTLDQGSDVFDPPRGDVFGDLYRLRKFAVLDALPPCGARYRDGARGANYLFNPEKAGLRKIEFVQ